MNRNETKLKGTLAVNETKLLRDIDAILLVNEHRMIRRAGVRPCPGPFICSHGYSNCVLPRCLAEREARS